MECIGAQWASCGRRRLGALGRNTGEVIGEFSGDLQTEPYPLALLRPGYKSSVDIANLVKLEQLEQRLKPPVWPGVFPAIDETKRSAGQRLFTERCAKCHVHLDREDLTTHIDVGTTMLKGPERIGTDPWMACNAYADSARTRFLIGTPKDYLALPPLRKLTLLGSTAPLLDMLATEGVGSMVGYAALQGPRHRHSRRHCMIVSRLRTSILRRKLN
jgi:hypothetical protein